jgi:alkylated DNA repair dioxygenase AlkB
MFLNETEVHRYQQCYLKTPKIDQDTLHKQSYMYSGYDTSNNNGELPELFQVYYDHMKSLDTNYNQVIANWYLDETDYIAHHSDCEIGMINNAAISIISLYGQNEQHNHVMSFIPKNGEINHIYDKLNIILRHGVVVTMCGTTQKEFKHGVATKSIHDGSEKSENSDVIARISLSFRQFIE